jgi:hypothetical protein
MSTMEELDRIAITVKSHRLLKRLLGENPKLEEIMLKAMNETEALVGVRNWVRDELRHRPAALEYYASEHPTREAFEALEWRDFASIRILDYIDNAGREFVDPNLRGERFPPPVRTSKPGWTATPRDWTPRSFVSGKRTGTGSWGSSSIGWTAGRSPASDSSFPKA